MERGEEQTIKLASDFCRQIGSPVEPVTAVVCPVQETGRVSHYLPRLKVIFAPLPLSRVAWVCKIDCLEKSFNFWIDVGTGDVLGGEASGGPIGT